MSDADEKGDLRRILVEQVDRLLADSAGPEVLRAAERGEWPEALWAEAEALGLPLALAPEEMGGADLGWEDAVAVWQVLGRHGAPLPLAHGMAAAALLGLAGIEPPPAGFSALALPGEAGGLGPPRPPRRGAGRGGQRSRCTTAPALEWRRAANPLSREPADRAATYGAPLRTGRLPGRRGRAQRRRPPARRADRRRPRGRARHDGGLRQDRASNSAARSAPSRRCSSSSPSAPSEAAAAAVACAAAGRAADRRGLHDAGFEIGSAKVVCGEAAGTGAAIVHQVHAAIGFTDEHPLHLFTRRMWSWRDAAGAERVWARRIGEAALARGGDALWPDLTARNEGRSGNA